MGLVQSGYKEVFGCKEQYRTAVGSENLPGCELGRRELNGVEFPELAVAE
jgi:hypothetical protein